MTRDEGCDRSPRPTLSASIGVVIGLVSPQPFSAASMVGVRDRQLWADRWRSSYFISRTHCLHNSNHHHILQFWISRGGHPQTSTSAAGAVVIITIDVNLERQDL